MHSGRYEASTKNLYASIKAVVWETQKPTSPKSFATSSAKNADATFGPVSNLHIGGGKRAGDIWAFMFCSPYGVVMKLKPSVRAFIGSFECSLWTEERTNAKKSKFNFYIVRSDTC